MKKSLTIGAVALALGLSIGSTSVFADEPVVTSDNPEQPVSNCIGQEGMNCAPVEAESGDEISEPGDEPLTDCIGPQDPNLPTTDCVSIIEEAPVECVGEENGTNECITSEIDPEGELLIEEEVTEPAEWPMYVSLGALGLAIVVFIVLNIFGGKKK